MKLLIKSPTIINVDSTVKADILVENGKIIKIADSIEPGSQQIIDATGLYAFPGGIDPHVHMELPTPAGNSCDDFRSGSIAALAGGTTTIIDFVTPARNQSQIEAVKMRKKEAEKSLIDYSLHGGITSLNNNTADEVRRCIVEEGITSFKVYLAYRNTIGIDYLTLRQVMRIVKKYNGIVTVHCEDGNEIIRLQKYFLSKGDTTPLYHALSHPEKVESDAVREVLRLSKETGCRVYIVHVSAKNSIELIAQFKNSGKVYAETCPQYLFLDESNYNKPLPESLKYVISPPLRNHDSMESLWTHISSGIVDVIATDHCPFNTFGQKDVGATDFTKIPNGVGGIEYRMELLFTYGVLKNRISLQCFVELTSANAARIFGMYPQKGAIAVNSDADIVLWNPDREKHISVQTQYQRCDSNIYEGMPVKGAPEYVISGGKIALTLGQVNTEGLAGKFLKRSI